jgi:hypothetical protein
MNERIRELNLQAMSIIMNGNDPDGDVDKMYVPSEFTKKFAELIVRESYIAARAQDENMGWDISGIINEHFGVEE